MVGCAAGHAHAATVARWRSALHVTQVVDAAAQPGGRNLVVAANGRLGLFRPGGTLAHPFPAYSTGLGTEPYIAVSTGQAVPGSGCRFPRGSTYALEPQGQAGVVTVSARGRVGRLATLPGNGLLSGIAFDTTGRFGHRLLVTRTETAAGITTVIAIDCRGRARTVTRAGTALEGGIAIAPRSFGRFAGQLIAPNELDGKVYAVSPKGHVRLVAESGLAHGADVGVESAGFVPHGFSKSSAAYLADRSTPGNPHPGDDELLTLAGSTLLRAGVRPGDLLVATEGGAQTIAVRCAASCRVRHIADGPAAAHAEGHIAFGSR